MDHFTKLDLNRKSESKTPNKVSVDQRDLMAFERHIAAAAGTFLLAALIGVFMVGTGCSNNSGKTEVSAPGPVSAQPAPVAPVVTPSLPVTEKHTAAVKSHKAGNYTNSRVGLSFDYPWQYNLKTGRKANLGSDGEVAVPMSFVQPGGVALSSVEMPQGFYPESDFISAYFNSSVNPKLSAEECVQFSSPGGTDEATALTPNQVQIGDLAFSEVESGSAKHPDAKYYHLYQNGMCYEFALGVRTTPSGPTDEIKLVDRNKVFRKLESMLATVKVDELDIPQTTAKVEAAPVAAPEPAEAAPAVTTAAPTAEANHQ